MIFDTFFIHHLWQSEYQRRKTAMHSLNVPVCLSERWITSWLLTTSLLVDVYTKHSRFPFSGRVLWTHSEPCRDRGGGGLQRTVLEWEWIGVSSLFRCQSCQGQPWCSGVWSHWSPARSWNVGKLSVSVSLVEKAALKTFSR